jgi:hypothetical protein
MQLPAAVADDSELSRHALIMLLNAVSPACVLSSVMGVVLRTAFVAIGAPDACAASSSTYVSPSTPTVASDATESFGIFNFSWCFFHLWSCAHALYSTDLNSSQSYWRASAEIHAFGKYALTTVL